MGRQGRNRGFCPGCSTDLVRDGCGRERSDYCVKGMIPHIPHITMNPRFRMNAEPGIFEGVLDKWGDLCCGSGKDWV